MRRWVHPEKARYYQADLVEDLLGGWSVVTAWGGLGSRRGQMRTAWVATREEGMARLEAIEKRRRQRGYYSIDTEHLE
jgi:predicted DNA-binding WGR domain protein